MKADIEIDFDSESAFEIAEKMMKMGDFMSLNGQCTIKFEGEGHYQATKLMEGMKK